MEEFLFVLHDLSARKFNLDVANQPNASVQLDGNIRFEVAYSLQFVGMDLNERTSIRIYSESNQI